MNEFLKQAAWWFVTVKAPDLKEKVEAGLDMIEGQPTLDDKYRKLFGFILFDYSMHMGPLSFGIAEKAATEIGVLVELAESANSWIEYSKNKSMTDNKRIIKFRGRCTHTGQWVFGSLVQANDGTFIFTDGQNVCFEEPEYHTHGMGCGLEDRNIIDRYEAMQHGFEKAVERVSANYPELIEVDLTTVGQFTGLLDHSDPKKEIYEGDIVHYMFDYDDEKLKKKAKRYTGNVYWEEEHSGFVVGPHRLVFNNGHFCQVEVIGNIYDNPELIAEASV